MTTLENELRNITHESVVAQCWKHGDPIQAAKEIREQAKDHRVLVVEMVGETLVTLVENLDTI